MDILQIDLSHCNGKVISQLKNSMVHEPMATIHFLRQYDANDMNDINENKNIYLSKFM